MSIHEILLTVMAVSSLSLAVGALVEVVLSSLKQG